MNRAPLLLAAALLTGCPWVGSDAYQALADADGDGEPSRAFGGNDCDDGDALVRDEIPQYTDGDEDGFGAGSPALVCPGTEGFSTQYGDCDDGNPLRSPLDADGDGVSLCGDDCDDGDFDVRAAIPGTWEDGDGDGHGAGNPGPHCPGEAFALIGDDCDDGDAAVGGPSLWFEDLDGDGEGDPTRTNLRCQSAIDARGGTDCDDDDASRNHQDADQDGVTTCAERPDCDDQDPLRSPFLREDCATAADDDCDGGAADSSGEVLNGAFFYSDGDGDGQGNVALNVIACAPPPGFVANSRDCRDADPLVFDEDRDGDGAFACAGIGADCDDDDAALPTTYYEDHDGDGFGIPSVPALLCEPNGDFRSTNTDDCDDSQFYATVPAVFFLDRDADSYGDAATGVLACSAPGTHQLGDCDDRNPQGHTTNPAAPQCGGLVADPDCDGWDDTETAACCPWVWPDADQDDWGDLTRPPVRRCGAPAPFESSRVGDPNDADELSPAPGDIVDVRAAGDVETALATGSFRILNFLADVELQRALATRSDVTVVFSGNGHHLSLGSTDQAPNAGAQRFVVQDLQMDSDATGDALVLGAETTLVDVVLEARSATAALRSTAGAALYGTEVHGGTVPLSGQTALAAGGLVVLVESQLEGDRSLVAASATSASQTRFLGTVNLAGGDPGLPFTGERVVVEATTIGFRVDTSWQIALSDALVSAADPLETNDRNRCPSLTLTDTTLVGARSISCTSGLLNVSLVDSVVWPEPLASVSAVGSLYSGALPPVFHTWNAGLAPSAWDLHLDPAVPSNLPAGAELGYYHDDASCSPDPEAGTTCAPGYAPAPPANDVPDAWMQRWFRSQDRAILAATVDADALDVVSEYLLGTSPLDADTDDDGVDDDVDSAPLDPLTP